MKKDVSIRGMQELRGVDARRVLRASPPLCGTTVVVIGIGAALAGPEWVPSALTREDGVIESLGFACLLVAGILTLVAGVHLRPSRRFVIAAVVIGVVLLVAAGEEVSWGQRVLDVDTPALLVDGNRQDELNLHNVDGLQERAVVAQLGVTIAGVMLALWMDRPWWRTGFPFFAGYLAYRGVRGIAAVVGWAPADRNSEAAELMLSLGLLVVAVHLFVHLHQSRRLPSSLASAA
jgi:lysylphosphatidylglycerol synthetase-like protein (DUF2156 family)